MYSLVTACMNREEHLRRSIPVWLQLPRVEEIIVVDWSNPRPLMDLLELDPRVRVVRVEDEPRWVLSYAYNLGIAEAGHPWVFKCDADCLPCPEITRYYAPGSGHFFAGHWESGGPLAKPSVNGQCLLTKEQFARINGYSEFIQTWGRDDEDLYERMEKSGFDRREIRPAFLDFIEHPKEARMAQQMAPAASGIGADAFTRTTMFQEMFNFHVSRRLPWGPDRSRAEYSIVKCGDRWKVVRRDKARELSLPSDIGADARLFAWRKLVSFRTKLSWEEAAVLDESTCLARLVALSDRTAEG